MPARYHDETELLSAEDVERIYRRTDRLDLHRDWVVLPLTCSKEGGEVVLPDGKVLLRAPGSASFEPWLKNLQIRLTQIGLSRTPRRSPEGLGLPPTDARYFGTRGYLKRQPDLNVAHPLPPQSSNDGE